MPRPVNATCDFEFSLWTRRQRSTAPGRQPHRQRGHRGRGAGDERSCSRPKSTRAASSAAAPSPGSADGCRSPCVSSGSAALRRRPRQELTRRVALALPGCAQSRTHHPSVIGGYSGNSAPAPARPSRRAWRAHLVAALEFLCRNSVTDMYGTIVEVTPTLLGSWRKSGRQCQLGERICCDGRWGAIQLRKRRRLNVGGGFKNAASATDSVVGGGTATPPTG